MMKVKSTFGQAIPVLASLNIARSLKFFNEVLGFKTSHLEDFSYGKAARGQVEIHFWLCAERRIAENTSCYVRVDSIVSLHDELKPKLPTLGDITQTAWGMAEIYVIDPDGNLIKFGQPIEDAESRVA